MAIKVSVLILLVCAVTAVVALALECPQVGNLGYNSYEGYLTKGEGLNKYFGPGVGYPADAGADYFHRYMPSKDWGTYGFGTGHMGEGYGPLIFSRRIGPTPPGLFDPLPGPLQSAPPPKISIDDGKIRVAMRSDIPGVKSVTVTMVAYNNADLATTTRCNPPYVFTFPVLDGVKNVRVRIDYVNNGLAATSYPL